MKKLAAGLLACVLFSIAANAQDANPAPQRHHNRKPHGQVMAQKLHFSDQQKDQLKNINSQYRSQLMELKKNDNITVKELKEKKLALRKAHTQQIQSVFTPEQKLQLQKMKEERKEMAKVNAKARAEKMKMKLGLSDEQAGQLKTLHGNMAAKMKALRSNESLSREQKKEQIKALAQEQKEQLRSVLTPDQLKQLEEMKKQHHKRDMVR